LVFISNNFQSQGMRVVREKSQELGFCIYQHVQAEQITKVQKRPWGKQQGRKNTETCSHKEPERSISQKALINLFTACCKME
jgi:N12 class adenine-specific DNA methylase